MSAIKDFYLARAEQCAREAQTTSLPNVRDRQQRAEEAWRNLASRVVTASGKRELQSD